MATEDLAPHASEDTDVHHEADAESGPPAKDEETPVAADEDAPIEALALLPGDGQANVDLRRHKEKDPEDMGDLPHELEAPSRLLARLLRYRTNEVAAVEGWSRLTDVLALPDFQAWDAEDIKTIVRESYSKDRPRFELKFEDDALWIRATFKHPFKRGAERRRMVPVEEPSRGVRRSWASKVEGGREGEEAEEGEEDDGRDQADHRSPKPGHGDDLVKSHLCRQFTRGLCTYGAECRFAHGMEDLNLRHRPRVVPPPSAEARKNRQLSGEASWKVQEQPRGAATQPYFIGDEAAGGPVSLRRSRNADKDTQNGNSTGSRRKGVCRQFAKGHCTYGDSCCFSHVAPGANGEGAPTKGGEEDSVLADSWPSWNEVIAESDAAAAGDAAGEEPASPAQQADAAKATAAEPAASEERAAEKSGEPEALRWNKFQGEGGQGCWYWREDTGDWFLEEDPGTWKKFQDPGTGNSYWWKDDGTDWFWDLTDEEWLALAAQAAE